MDGRFGILRQCLRYNPISNGGQISMTGCLVSEPS